MSISKHLSNCSDTLPLTRQQSIDNTLGLMLGKGSGLCAVVQILILILIQDSTCRGDSTRCGFLAEVKILTCLRK